MLTEKPVLLIQTSILLELLEPEHHCLARINPTQYSGLPSKSHFFEKTKAYSPGLHSYVFIIINENS